MFLFHFLKIEIFGKISWKYYFLGMNLYCCLLLEFGFPSLCFSLVQSLSHVRLFATPWIAARQASLSITNSRSSLKLTSIESVMPSSHLILCRPFSLLPQSLPASESFPMSECFTWGGQCTEKKHCIMYDIWGFAPSCLNCINYLMNFILPFSVLSSSPSKSVFSVYLVKTLQQLFMNSLENS